jgi:hypothetical protein
VINIILFFNENGLNGWWLVVGGWWLVVGGWWLVVGGWWLVVGGWFILCTNSPFCQGVFPITESILHLFIFFVKAFCPICQDAIEMSSISAQ